uniref:Zinc finger HIT-type containing 1 n=1 Tax=Pongo abelii TaxID=9601 RepID=A0A8I5T3K2_PONAB
TEQRRGPATSIEAGRAADLELEDCWTWRRPAVLSRKQAKSLFLLDEVRSQDPGQRRVLDRAARQRRINRQLEALENDNFQDDPHAGLPQLGKRLPQFDDDADTGKKKKKTRGDHFKLRFRKNFQALLEEQNLSVAEGPNYLTACAGPPSRPQRPFCAVCGFPSPYTCVSCGARYCTVRCLGTHQETRCLKWTV